MHVMQKGTPKVVSLQHAFLFVMVTTGKTKIIAELFNNNIYSCRTLFGKLVSTMFYDISTVFNSVIDGFNFLLYNSIVHYQSL